MASVGIRCGGNRLLDCRFLKASNRDRGGHVGFCSVRNGSAGYNNLDSLRCKQLRVASASMERELVQSTVVSPMKDGNASQSASAVVYEKMDEWMRDSVGEIVKNLREAPLLVHVYSSDEDQSGGGVTRLRTEKAVEDEDWPVVLKRWQKRETRLPEGVIFVEKLEDTPDIDLENDEMRREDEEFTRAWGIVVQGRGVDCGPICYLLKTSRVGGSEPGSGSGLGLCCTHFCLMRVKSFRETTRSQFKNFWLLQGQ